MCLHFWDKTALVALKQSSCSLFNSELSPAVCPSFRSAHVLPNNSEQTLLACGTHAALCKALLHREPLLKTGRERPLDAALECIFLLAVVAAWRGLAKGTRAPLIRVGSSARKEMFGAQSLADTVC